MRKCGEVRLEEGALVPAVVRELLGQVELRAVSDTDMRVLQTLK